MSAVHLGHYNTATSRTHVRFQFSTHAAAGGNVAPNSAFEAADLRIYRANGGAAFSATQRSSANGVTMTSPFDSLTGFHDVDIDLTDNTDAGFYAAGYFYSVVLAPDETVDSQTLTGIVLAYFEIGPPEVNTTQVSGTAQTAGDLKTLIDAVDNFVDNEIADIQARLPAALVGGRIDANLGAISDAAGVRAAIGLASANLDTQLAKLDTIDDFLDTEIAAILAAVDTEVAAIQTAVVTSIPATLAALFTTALSESYRTDGATGSVAQLLYEILAHHAEKSIASTTLTTKKIDGSTTAATHTLNSATTPTSITRAS